MRRWLGNVLNGGEREAWVRFVVAIGGLALAFAAALLSTAAREAGDMLSTAVLASSALVLATLVGVVAVPFLARRALARRMREVLSYDVTREGLFYLVLTILIAVGALNTGNNLLFIVVAAMLAAVLISGIVSAVMLLGLEVDFSAPQHVFARRSYAAEVYVRNPRRFPPSFSISVVPPPERKLRTHWHWRRTEFIFPPPHSGKKPWVRWPDLSLEKVRDTPEPPQLFHGRIYLPYVPTRQTLSAPIDLEFPERGRYRQQGIGLATRFPFSFLLKTRVVPLSREVLVFPAVEETPQFLEVLPTITGELESYSRGRGHDLYRIRNYQPEDSARHVDWKSTAKLGILQVREFTREDERRVRLIFDNPHAEVLAPEAYESAVSLAASLGWHFAQESTDISFVAPAYPGDSDIYHFLSYLAEVQPEANGAASILDTLSVTDDYKIVLTTRERGTIPSSLWESAYLIFLGTK
jgi:uncharacterized protein (DUF58 family)